MNRRLSRPALAAVCATLVAAMPAAADCEKFNARVTSAELPRGFTDIVRKDNILSRRDAEVPAEYVLDGFDSCRVVDEEWVRANPNYGEPKFVCTRDMKAGPSGTITFEEVKQQMAEMAPQIDMLTGCILADPRFKVDRQTPLELSYIMKPELTDMRGMYDNPRVAISMMPMGDRLKVEPSDKDPWGMMQPQTLTLTISGIAQDFTKGPEAKHR